MVSKRNRLPDNGGLFQPAIFKPIVRQASSASRLAGWSNSGRRRASPLVNIAQTIQAILLAIATVASSLRLPAVRSATHVLSPRFLVFLQRRPCALPARTVCVDLCFRACWYRSPSACRQGIARQELLPARWQTCGTSLVTDDQHLIEIGPTMP
jgi:hypothetical protein